MSQHDYSIANQTAPSLRTDLNNALSAIVSQNSGTTAPSTTYANMLWYDTTNDILKMRNEANTGWIELLTFDQGSSLAYPSNIASQAEAEAGTNNTKVMTALRVAQAVAVGLPASIYSELSSLTVSASDLYDLTGNGAIGLNQENGSLVVSSAAYQMARTWTIEKVTGSLRFNVSHATDNSLGPSVVRYTKNGTEVISWSNSSSTPVARTVDISIVPTDVIVLEHRSLYTSTLTNVSVTGSNRWEEEPLYNSAV